MENQKTTFSQAFKTIFNEADNYNPFVAQDSHQLQILMSAIDMANEWANTRIRKQEQTTIGEIWAKMVEYTETLLPEMTIEEAYGLVVMWASIESERGTRQEIKEEQMQLLAQMQAASLMNPFNPFA